MAWLAVRQVNVTPYRISYAIMQCKQATPKGALCIACLFMHFFFLSPILTTQRNIMLLLVLQQPSLYYKITIIALHLQLSTCIAPNTLSTQQKHNHNNTPTQQPGDNKPAILRCSLRLTAISIYNVFSHHMQNKHACHSRKSIVCVCVCV